MSLGVAVIGGGISGLASAARAAGLGMRVTLFEGDADLGGLGTTFPWRDRHLERFYHCVLPTDRELIRWIHEVGLGHQLMWKHVAMGFTYRRRRYSLSTPLDLLRFDPLSLGERLRLGLMGLRARRSGDDPGLDDVTAESWVRRHAGDRVFEVLWKPLLEAKIGDGYPAIPALWLTSRLAREKNAGPEIKGCLAGGYRSLIDAFADHLRARDVTIRMNTRVAAIERSGEGMALVLEGGGREEYDLVVSTLPLVQFQAMTRSLGLDPAIAGLDLDYQGVISGIFLTEKPLTRYYWMPVVDSGLTAQGLVEMSNLVPLERANGLHVNYLMNYTHRRGPLFAKPDDELLALYRADLEALFPEASRTIVDQYLFRAPYVEPIWSLQYSRRRPPTRVIPGRLYLACTAQVYPEINSWNSCCNVVERMVPEMTADLGGAVPRGAVAGA
jgi:protoporphyrinogen oxidase